MHRKTFLAVIGTLGFVIGLVALCFPAVLLAGKGVAPEPAVCVWVREVGVLIVALSTILLLVRGQPDTPAMCAVLWGNAIVHGGLLPIEIIAWHGGVITRLDGIAPNSVLHAVAAIGFAFFARRVVTSNEAARDHV
jgi:hypothetical protein